MNCFFLGGPICYVSCLAAVGGGGFIAGVAVLPLLGFKYIGIAAGLWAATWMASYGGAIPTGCIFAQIQEAGVAGVFRSAFRSISGFCAALCAPFP